MPTLRRFWCTGCGPVEQGVARAITAEQQEQDDGDVEAGISRNEGELGLPMLHTRAWGQRCCILAPAMINPSTPSAVHISLNLCAQSVKDMPVLQDGPPPGGFPSVRYARRLPSTGPTGFTMFAVGAAVMAYGFYKVTASPEG